jgi:hypothetical protein
VIVDFGELLQADVSVAEPGERGRREGGMVGGAGLWRALLRRLAEKTPAMTRLGGEVVVACLGGVGVLKEVREETRDMRGRVDDIQGCQAEA